MSDDGTDMARRDDDVEATIRQSYMTQRAAMVAGDAAALGDELSDGFTLTHMTGYVQPRHAWLAQVESGEMTYHSIDDVGVAVDLRDDEPILTARTRTDATIWGGRGVWRLLLEIHFKRVGDRFIAAKTVASTW